jgi:glycosyltransferase involved in cell wall biosynthesis
VLRILLVTLQTELAGGLEIYSRDVACSLQSLGHDVSVVSALEQPKAVTGWGRVPIRFLAPANRMLLRAYFRVWPYILTQFLRSMKNQYDLFLILHPYAAISAYRAGLERYHTWTYGIEVWGDWSRSLRLGLQHADRVIAISAHTRDVIRKQLPHKTVDLIHPIVNTSWFTPIVDSSHSTTAPFRLLTVGRLVSAEAYKGHDVVIRSLKTIQHKVNMPVQYWIAGDGDDRPRLEKLVCDYEVQDSVDFLGRVSDSSLLDLYRSCDLFVMPSSREGFGIVYIEASACGKPVVGSSLGGAIDAVQHGVTGFCINPNSDEELVQSISRLLLDPDLAKKMGGAGRRFVEERFSQQALDNGLKELLGEL